MPHFDGDVVVDSVSVEITLELPAIVNRSQTCSTSLQLQFVRTASPSVFDYFFSLVRSTSPAGSRPRVDCGANNHRAVLRIGHDWRLRAPFASRLVQTPYQPEQFVGWAAWVGLSAAC